MAFKSLERIADNKLEIEYKSRQLEQIRKEIRRANARSVSAITGGSLVVSAALIAGLDGLAPTMIGAGLFHLPLASILLGVPGLLILLGLIDRD